MLHLYRNVERTDERRIAKKRGMHLHWNARSLSSGMLELWMLHVKKIRLGVERLLWNEC